MKKYVVLFIGVVLVAFIISCVIFMGDHELDLNSKEVTTLYSYLGEVDVYHCGGLNQYTKEEVTYDDISTNNKLCQAYYATNKDNIENRKSNTTTTNDQDIDICEVGDNIRLAALEGENTCSYQIISEDDLNKAYHNVYGTDIPKEDNTSFNITATKSCYLEEGEYYCGDAENYTWTLRPEATIYRLPAKATKKMNGDIVITDYYLRISENKCYSSNNTDSEITACSNALSENPDTTIDSEFVQEYGTLYEHTFKKNSNGTNYWYSSNIK